MEGVCVKQLSLRALGEIPKSEVGHERPEASSSSNIQQRSAVEHKQKLDLYGDPSRAGRRRRLLRRDASKWKEIKGDQQPTCRRRRKSRWRRRTGEGNRGGSDSGSRFFSSSCFSSSQPLIISTPVSFDSSSCDGVNSRLYDAGIDPSSSSPLLLWTRACWIRACRLWFVDDGWWSDVRCCVDWRMKRIGLKWWLTVLWVSYSCWRNWREEVMKVIVNWKTVTVVEGFVNGGWRIQKRVCDEGDSWLWLWSLLEFGGWKKGGVDWSIE